MPRMLDIAREAGVSRTVVSLVLNGRGDQLGIAKQTQEKVLSIAASMGYYRNELAAATASRRGRIIAFVTGNMGSVEYTGRVQNGVLDAATDAGYAVTVLRMAGHSHEDILKSLMGWCVGGVLFHVLKLEEVSDICKVLDKQGIFYGTVNLGNPNGIGVTTDDKMGMAEAVAFLAKRGCHKVAYFDHRADSCNSEYQSRRRDGYKLGLQRCLPEQAPVIFGCPADDFRKVPELVDAMLLDLREQGVDGVICVNDHYALSIEQAALRLGMDVPRQMSIIGFSNSEIADMASPAITSISQNFEQMGAEAVRLLVSAINNKALPQEGNVLLPVKIVERESTRK